MYSYIYIYIYIHTYIYSSLSDAISNLNYKYMEDHMFLIYDNVSMGNWFLTFQGNLDVSSSMVNLTRLDNRRGDHSTVYMATKT
jgi:hypothetical protein